MSDLTYFIPDIHPRLPPAGPGGQRPHPICLQGWFGVKRRQVGQGMKRIELTLCAATLAAFAATAAPAQTTCPVAQLISPTPGSTLPAGAVTFEWCNANADYFLTVESIPGAHDIFFAFAGGAGPGAGVISITLGPACAPTSPTGCIPANGESIFVALWTLKHGTVVPPSPFNYTFTAAKTVPAPAATTTTVGSSSIPFSGDAQSVTLTATVAAASTVNQGTVTFQVMDGATNIGTAVTSAALIGGNAGVIYLLPARTVPNSYTVQAAYSGGPAFQASSGSGTLTVSPSPPQRSRSPRTLPWRGSGTIAPARAPDGWIACGQACTMVLREAE